MPKASVWLVRVALLHFAAGALLGSYLLASKAMPLPGWPWALRTAHVEGLIVGFVAQLAFGVALWILPRAPVRAGVPPAAVAGALLNVGVGLVMLGAALPLAALVAAGRVAEAIAVAAFAAHVWPRVRAARGTHQEAPVRPVPNEKRRLRG